MRFFQKHPVIISLLVLFLCCTLFMGICFFRGIKVLCIKFPEGGEQHGISFITKTRAAADILEKSDFSFQVTPEITAQYRNGNMHVREREGAPFPFETMGILRVDGTFYYYPIEDDVYPAFTRDELFDRLLEAAKKELPPEERDNVQLHREHVDKLFAPHDAAREYIGNMDASLRFNRKFSHLFGSVDD